MEPVQNGGPDIAKLEEPNDIKIRSGKGDTNIGSVENNSFQKIHLFERGIKVLENICGSEKISEGNICSLNFAWINDNSFASVGLCGENGVNLSIWDNFIKTEKNILGECKIYSMKINYNNNDVIPFINRNKKERILIYLVNKQDILNPTIPPLPSITVYEFKDKQ